MLKEKIKEKEAELNGLITERRSLLDDSNKATEAKQIHDIRTKLNDKNSAIEKVQAELDDLKNLEAEEKRSFNPVNDEDNGPHHRGGGANFSKRDAINKYIHTRDASDAQSAGITTKDNQVLIPEDIKYEPTEEIKSMTDLSKFVTVYNAPAASGSYPLVKRATAQLHTVEELAKNPALAKPEFMHVDWKVDTYRGSIPISQEDIQDSKADLMSIVANNANEQKINTTNAVISNILQSFTKKTVSGDNVDDIKHILNVDLDPAYSRSIIASQSFYNYLDTLKDKNGRYLLNDPITTGSPATLLGVPVIVVNDELLGKAGDANAFVGDAKRAILFPKRAEMSIRWVDNDVYGAYLGVAIRFGATKADEKAGYFVTAGTTTGGTKATK